MGEGKIGALQVTPVYPLGEKDATEDEEDSNYPEPGFYATHLHGIGYRVEIARWVSEVIRRVRDRNIQVVLLDDEIEAYLLIS